ncbi:MAG: hypothetical protein APF84_18960 [Gracilibacter sp. BRH_c7a]|nr:MAG: hypothetical protein APF84_18960 [Gracilibacter sp. BRH_c7a]
MRIMIEESYQQLRQDLDLQPIVEKWGRCNLKPGENYYWELVRSILAQQISTKVAQKLGARFLEYFQGDVTPVAVSCSSAEELRCLGVSARKAETILTIAFQCQQGKINLNELDNKSDQEIQTELTKVKGIGSWTVTMFLIFALNRPRVVPSADFGIRKAIQIIYGLEELPSPAMVDEYYRAWKPHESAVSWYLWRSLENN